MSQTTQAEHTENEAQLQHTLSLSVALSASERAQIVSHAAALVRQIRAQPSPGIMEVFLSEYGLSTDEGIALMCLAEALLRVPDTSTIDALIEDKIASSDWSRHLGHSTSPLVNASTWALLLTGKVLENETPGPAGHLRRVLKRLGEPAIRTAVARAMKEMGRQFVLGETIESALTRAAKMQQQGYTYSYDMLGEAAKTDADAQRYFRSYSCAIAAIATACCGASVHDNPGISVKLSALHPRYEMAQKQSVIDQLAPRLQALAVQAKAACIGLNIDAEEADRLDLSLEVIERVLASPALADWAGFGVVVQAYQRRARTTLQTIYQMAQRYERQLTVRLVKGAYWDTEIKHAQVLGLDDFPVFTSKRGTDISYLACARQLFSMTDRIYPQFATHNAHTVSAIVHMAGDQQHYEFQRLHGMGEHLHKIVKQAQHTRCRIYAPVGAHRDLLAYLVRRLLENGANSSFVNQVVDNRVPAEQIVVDPLLESTNEQTIATGAALFLPERQNSKGYDLRDQKTLDWIDAQRTKYIHTQWHATPIVDGDISPCTPESVENPYDAEDNLGCVAAASEADIATALSAAQPWRADAQTRREILLKAADLYEQNLGVLFSLLAREAGKIQLDAVGELREAVDFLRYYALQATDHAPIGRVTCISPWNFPLAIFTGQISAALAAGNAVLAKPAEQTPLIAHAATGLLHQAGVPVHALQLLPGSGAKIGAALTRDARIDAVTFTGSTATAMRIRQSMAEHLQPGAPLIAETGGLNAMIVDSTALLEQAVSAIMESAFQSAGQRCSALRCLYVQADIAQPLIEMLIGAMETLTVGNPWALCTDIGPIIDRQAKQKMAQYIFDAEKNGTLIHKIKVPDNGYFIPPCLLNIRGIEELKSEIFGPVLHIALFQAEQLDSVISAINDSGYGLTFGLQTRINDRVQHLVDQLQVGNIYVNRNQIGAVVGSQPFGGEGLSGTGPKAGGPHYLQRLKYVAPRQYSAQLSEHSTLSDVQKNIDQYTPNNEPSTSVSLPGPTGESNRLTCYPRAPILCLGPGPEALQQQLQAVADLGGNAVAVTGALEASVLTQVSGISAVLWWGDTHSARAYEQALAARSGPILPLLTGVPDMSRTHVERHVCIDTTAAGGNTQLLSGAS